MRHVIASSLVLFAAFVGCSDDDGSDNSTSVERRIAAAYCDFLQRCYPYDTGENISIMMVRGASDAQCVDFVQRVLFNGHLDAGVADGSLKVDQAKLDACVSALGSECVDDVRSLCGDPIEGKVAAGGTCVSSDDCAGDAFCSYEGCEPVCVARHAPGESCGFNDDECSQATGRHGCSDSGKCLPKHAASATAAEGAACGSVEADGELLLTACATGFACESSTCQKIGAAGASCQNDHSPCALGNVCIESNDAADTGTCTALPLVNQAGAACNEDFEGGSPVVCNWALGLGCRGGKCVAAGDGSVGATCFADQDFPNKCDAGNYCGADDKCAAQKDNGATCDDSDECKSGNCETTCQPLVCE